MQKHNNNNNKNNNNNIVEINVKSTYQPEQGCQRTFVSFFP